MNKFNLTLHYRPGKQIHLSETLSQRGHELNTDPEITGLKLDKHLPSQEVNASVTYLQEI